MNRPAQIHLNTDIQLLGWSPNKTDKCETPFASLISLKWFCLSQTLVRGSMFVTESFTQTDQGGSSHTQTSHMSVDRGIICSKWKVRVRQQLRSIERQDGFWITQRGPRFRLLLKGLEWQKMVLYRNNAGFHIQLNIEKTLCAFTSNKNLTLIKLNLKYQPKHKPNLP